jgi:hypothetical protein
VKFKAVLVEFSCVIKTWSFQGFELPPEHGPCEVDPWNQAAAPVPILPKDPRSAFSGRVFAYQAGGPSFGAFQLRLEPAP